MFAWLPVEWQAFIYKFLIGLIAMLFGASIAGCSTGLIDQHVKEFDTMRAMAVDAASRLQDGSIAQMQVSGQGLEPGITVEAGLKYYATAYYKGLAGQFGVSSQGAMTNREAPEYIQKILMARDMNDSAKLELIGKLVSEWLASLEKPTPTSQPVE